MNDVPDRRLNGSETEPEPGRNPILKRDDRIVSRDILGECILVPIARTADDISKVWLLNEVGSFVWNLLDGKKTLGQIISEVGDNFDVSLEQAERDLLNFIDQLLTIGAVKEFVHGLPTNEEEKLR